jgi:nitrite reductase/ring-hydroxylating ferredoxin subunit
MADMQPDAAIAVGHSGDLVDGGNGIRFAVTAYGAAATGFVVRHQGAVYGYLNRCAHVPIELDWAQGEFFESGKRYIMCQTHGAIYAPETGLCAGGPCRGGRLRPIAVHEAGGVISWFPDEAVRPPLSTSNDPHHP